MPLARVGSVAGREILHVVEVEGRDENVARTQPSQRDVAELSDEDPLELLETVLRASESSQIPDVVPDGIVEDILRALVT